MYGTNFHIASDDKIIECRHLFNGDVVNEFKPECNLLS